MATGQNPNIVARYGTYQEFLTVYQPSMAATWVDGRGDTLLHEALSNNNRTERKAIARRLLDDGANAAAIGSSGRTTAQLLIARVTVDRRPDLEAPLLAALFDAGCNVNHVSPRDGTALLQLAGRFNMSDDELAPLYDVFLARPDLDLLSVTSYGRSDLASIRRWGRRRASLLNRLEGYLQSRGLEPPSETVFDLASWADPARILAVYVPTHSNAVEPESGRTLLHIVLDNSDLEARLSVASQLLDDGADPTATTPEGLTPAHILLRGYGARDFTREAALLQRLFDTGADVNAVAPKGVGAPLNCLARMSNSYEETRAPLYDVLLNHPDFDPLTKIGRSKTAWDAIGKTGTEVLRGRLEHQFPHVERTP